MRMVYYSSMEKVVYLLGAGFSAPLGLPLVNNFLMNAKDMFAKDQNRYAHFSKVFDSIAEMLVAKSYFRTDLFNIEEILSILEMRERAMGSDLGEFIVFIKEVIEYFTPAIPKFDVGKYNWWDAPFVDASPWINYFTFAASLLRLVPFSAEGNDHGRKYNYLVSRPIPEPQTQYNVITLNYDLVLESMENLLMSHKDSHSANRFKTDFSTPSSETSVALAKIHGSVDSGNIIAPTWNKHLSTNMSSVWEAALKMLTEANHIRIVGYSLPIADAYIKYLLKAAVLKSSHLKRIDVLCLDSYGDVKQRYDEFIDFKYYRFCNARTEQYLAEVQTATSKRHETQSKERHYDQLEAAHEKVFLERATR